MKEYKISVHGCDDTTILTEKLTEEEYKVINRIAKRVTETSEYVCMPVMNIKEIEENAE